MKKIILPALCFFLFIEVYPSISTFTNSQSEQNSIDPKALIAQAVEAFYEGEYLKVIKLSKRALSELEKNTNPNEINRFRIAACYDNIGQSYQYLGIIDSADLNYQQAVEVMTTLSYNKADKFPTFQRYASLKINLGQYQEAIDLLEQLFDLSSPEQIAKIDKEPYNTLSLGRKAQERKAEYFYDGMCEDELEFMLFFEIENATKKSARQWNQTVRGYAPLYITSLVHLAQSYVGLKQPEMAEKYTYLSMLLYQNLKYSLKFEKNGEIKKNLLFELQCRLYAVTVQYRQTFGVKPADYFVADFNNEELLEVINEFGESTSIHFQPFFDLLTDYIDYLLQWGDYQGASSLLNTYMPKYKNANSLYTSKLYFLDAKRMLKFENTLENNYTNLVSGEGKSEIEINHMANDRFKESIREAMKYYESNQYALSLDEQKKFWESTYQLIQTYYGAIVENVLVKNDRSPHLKNGFLESILEIQTLTKGKSLSNALSLKRAMYSSGNDSLKQDYQNLLRLREQFSALVINKAENEGKGTMDSLLSAIKDSERKMMKYLKIEPDREFNLISIQEELNEKDAYVEIVKLNYLFTEKKFKYYEEYRKPIEYTDESGNTQKTYGQNVYEYNTKNRNKYLIVIVRKNNIFHRLLDGEYLNSKGVGYYKNTMQFKVKDTLSYGNFWQEIEEGNQRDYMTFFYEMSGKRQYYIPESYTLKNCEKIYYCPDGVYNIINPVSLFNTQTEEYLNKEHDFVLISSPRYFFDDESEITLTDGEVILFGNPNFQEKAVSADRVGNQERAILNLFNGNISPLPGTAHEVNNISSILTNQFNTSAFKAKEATETNLRKVNSPYMLHIATHGFYMRTENGSPLEQMSNSGLLFTGFMAGNDQYTDGVFSSQEASALNLEGTTLVTLSACQSGLGEVQNGDGVYGLQMGFSIAGAKNIILSLWAINDKATAQWMRKFYTHFAENQNIEKAYNHTISDLQKEYEHPYYWGPFVLLKN